MISSLGQGFLDQSLMEGSPNQKSFVIAESTSSSSKLGKNPPTQEEPAPAQPVPAMPWLAEPEPDEPASAQVPL